MDTPEPTFGCNRRESGQWNPPRIFTEVMMTMTHELTILLGLAMAATLTSSAEEKLPPPVESLPVVSPEVHSDNRVTFRLRAPNSKQTVLHLEGAKPLAMEPDEQGLRSVTTEALEPDFYGYEFTVDGVRVTDPSNTALK